MLSAQARTAVGVAVADLLEDFNVVGGAKPGEDPGPRSNAAAAIAQDCKAIDSSAGTNTNEVLLTAQANKETGTVSSAQACTAVGVTVVELLEDFDAVGGRAPGGDIGQTSSCMTAGAAQDSGKAIDSSPGSDTSEVPMTAQAHKETSTRSSAQACTAVGVTEAELHEEFDANVGGTEPGLEPGTGLISSAQACTTDAVRCQWLTEAELSVLLKDFHILSLSGRGSFGQ
eukprot:3155557-Karenia_brevis.AAC.1